MRVKKLICLLLSVAVLAAGLPAATAFAAHTHAGTLQSLKTAAGQSIPCCGVFRCAECGKTYEATVTPKDVGMPIVTLEGDLSGMTKETKVTARLSFASEERSFTTLTTMKWQGDSSLRYPKKNYSVSFITESGGKNKVEVRPEWGRQSKYCLKANWVDLSAARNIVSAKLWGEVVHSECRDDPVDALLNGGAIDGFPVLLYANGDFQGLYTFNTPKDKWIYGMGDGQREGLMMANGYRNCVCMYEPIADVNDPAASQWEVEYCSTEDAPEGSAWLSEALNNLINVFVNYEGQELKDRIGQYMDVERAIDYLVFITALRAEDNRAKNIMWATYDGVKFAPLAYDLEGTWGMNWSGSFVTDRPEVYPTPTDTNFLRKMVDCYGDEIAARYAALRKSVLSVHNIERLFSEYEALIPALVYQAEKDRWPDQPGVASNTIAQCKQYARKHLRYLDGHYGITVTETANSAYRAAFTCLNGAKVYLPSPDGQPVRTAEAYSVDAAGAMTKSGGQVDFLVPVPEGYRADVSVSPAGGFAALLSPGQTGIENGWRITGITKDLAVAVSLTPDAESAEGYTVTFDCEAGLRVLVYPGQDYTVTPVETTRTVSVDAATGLPTRDGGQVNFKVLSDNGADVFAVTASPKNYKNLKGYEDTGVPNVFRMTKITGDVTVTVRRDTAHVHDYSYHCAVIPGNREAHSVYCACGQQTEQAHSFSQVSEGGEKYNVCSACGYRYKLTQCGHICHSENAFARFIWRIELFIFRLFRINRVCECGVAHY